MTWNTQTAGVKLEISTHTLTWSVTRAYRGRTNRGRISTHTLTWSVTKFGKWIYSLINYFNSHAHVERDAVIIKYITANFYFNSHAHVERDT